jgi:hypothetical protein
MYLWHGPFTGPPPRVIEDETNIERRRYLEGRKEGDEGGKKKIRGDGEIKR